MQLLERRGNIVQRTHTCKNMIMICEHDPRNNFRFDLLKCKQ